MVDGPYAFLFTDIEGSTKLWEAMPDSMSASLVQHDAIMRSAIESNGGEVFKTVGDAFCSVFSTVRQAASASVEAQLKLAEADWGHTGPLRVRMAVHVGKAERRDNDFYGPTLNRAARILSAGHGGQVLLSRDATEALGEFVQFVDLGFHRLKDLGEPVRIAQLVHPALPEVFPPLATLRAERHNLPIQSSSFVGREHCARAVIDMLARARIVTLVGPGGVGKTRLALQIAAEAIDGFRDGAWYVSLESLSDQAHVAAACAAALGLALDASKPPSEALAAAIGEKQVLILLDTCEHILDGVVNAVSCLLRQCPSVKVIATSREPLGVSGEQTCRVPALEVPTMSEPDPDKLIEVESVQLFCDRAASAQQTFRLDSSTAPCVARVCATLDGIPLAIELAAARASALTIDEIDRRLDDRFRLLTKGRSDALPRHQTLLALVEWSYNLLDDLEQAVLRCVSVFSGGWDLGAAEAVCARSVPDSWDVVDHLTSLVDKSLVQFDPHSGRYTLLQSVRVFARQKLSECGEEETTLSDHSTFYQGWTVNAMVGLGGSDPGPTLKVLEAEHDNLRQAFRYQLGNSEAEPRSFLSFSLTLGRFWELRGHLWEGYENVQAALERFGAERGKEAADCLNALGNIARHLGKIDEAERHYRQSLERRRALNDPHSLASSLSNLASLAIMRGELDSARELIAEAHTANVALGDQAAQAINLVVLGNVEGQRGDMEAAHKAFCEARELSLVSGHRMALLYSLVNLGLNASKQANWEDAERHLAESLGLCLELGERTIAADALRFLAQAKVRQIQWEDAVIAFASAARVREEIGAAIPPCDEDEYASDIERLRSAVGAGFDEMWAQGRRAGWEDACRRFAPPSWIHDLTKPS